MELQEAKKIFLLAKKSENVSSRTFSLYEFIFSRFYQFLTERDIYDISLVDENIIREFLLSLKNKNLRGITQHLYFRNIRTFFRFLYQNDYISSCPIDKVKPPKKEQKVMRTFTAEEISKLLKAFDRNTFHGLRNYCIFCTLFSTGMRKSELVNLTLADLNLTGNMIRISRGKGNKERYVPIGRTLKQVLTQYLRRREEYLDGDFCQYVFVTLKDNHKMTVSAIDTLFHRLKKELNLTGEKISCHTWRHTFAKNYLLNGGDIFSLQKILGHADIATTKNYLNLNEKEVKMQHAKFNPLDNRDWLY